MQKLAVNGETLRYERAGSGPPLLLVHSLGTGAWMWRREIVHWSTRFDVIAFDVRGHGASSHNGPVTVEAIAGDLCAALEALGVGPAHVVAISMGGPIASHLYAIAPQAIASLVFVDSFARQGEAGAVRARNIADLLAITSMEAYAGDYAKQTLHADTDPRVGAELAASIAALGKDVYLEVVLSVFTADVADIMSRITVPVLVVVGAQDTRTPPDLSREIVRLIPHAKMQLVERAAHLSNLDNPEGVWAAIDPFLEAQVR